MIDVFARYFFFLRGEGEGEKNSARIYVYGIEKRLESSLIRRKTTKD